MIQKKLVALALLGEEMNNIQGFVQYHEPWVDRFEFVQSNADKFSIDFVTNHPKCRLTTIATSCFHEEDKARNILQEKVDYDLETSLMLDLDERLDLRTLGQITTEHFTADVTYGLINNCDNYFLVDHYSRIMFSNIKLEFKWHTHCWPINTLNASKFMLTFPKANHFIQTPYKKSGSDNQWDYDTSPMKFSDKQMAKLFIDGRYQEVIKVYQELIKTDYLAQGLSKRVNFYWFMVAVLACEQLNKPCPFPVLPFADEANPTKTEVATLFLYDNLNGNERTIDLAPFKINLHGVVSSYAKAKAICRGATDSQKAGAITMWNP
jgi:hypothetical protein